MKGCIVPEPTFSPTSYKQFLLFLLRLLLATEVRRWSLHFVSVRVGVKQRQLCTGFCMFTCSLQLFESVSEGVRGLYTSHRTPNCPIWSQRRFGCCSSIHLAVINMNRISFCLTVYTSCMLYLDPYNENVQGSIQDFGSSLPCRWETCKRRIRKRRDKWEYLQPLPQKLRYPTFPPKVLVKLQIPQSLHFP